MTGQGVADLEEIVQLVGDDLRRVEDFFQEQVRSDIPLIARIGSYIREGGGKRIRPALLLLSCRLNGYRGPRAILLAAVVEFIHTWPR
jgi:octaprenyl-diphosphate synthase